ncbi:MAG: hypothetical protein ACREJ5_10605 [Geminicoccaceae bacterium]
MPDGRNNLAARAVIGERRVTARTDLGDLGRIVERLQARGRLSTSRTRPPAWAGAKAPFRFGPKGDFR